MESMSMAPGDQVFEASQTISRPREEVFSFFADPANLEKITPPWLRFRIADGNPTEIGTGTQFDYNLRVHGLPMRWRSLIDEWVPGSRFVDIQLKGPYAKWHHLHIFEDADDGAATRISDRVIYRLPFHPLSQALGGWFIRSDLKRIFGYRARLTSEILEGL